MVGERLSNPENHVETRDEKRYTRMLNDFLSPITFVIAFLLCLFVLHLPIEPAEQLADTLALDEDEAALIIPPLARILDKQHLDDEAKTRLTEAGDIGALCVGLGSYGARLLGTIRDIGRMITYEHSQANTGAPVQSATAANRPGEPLNTYTGANHAAVFAPIGVNRNGLGLQ